MEKLLIILGFTYFFLATVAFLYGLRTGKWEGWREFTKAYNPTNFLNLSRGVQQVKSGEVQENEKSVTVNEQSRGQDK